MLLHTQSIVTFVVWFYFKLYEELKIGGIVYLLCDELVHFQEMGRFVFSRKQTAKIKQKYALGKLQKFMSGRFKSKFFSNICGLCWIESKRFSI